MKLKFKFLVAVICALTMIASIGATAFAGESEIDIETVYKMAQKALDQQAIQNVMSRHVMYHCYGEHEEEMVQLWVNEPENRATASFGQNQGYFVGYDNIWEAYVDAHDTSWLSSAKKYCESNNIDIEGWTDEQILDVYGGVGQLLMHCTTTSIIEVAEDGQTARCFWYSPGLVSETGSAASTIWEAYGVDFVKEGNEWKIWHLHMYTDFTGSFYIDLTGNGSTQETGDSSGDSASDAAAPADGESQGEQADAPAAEAGESDGESSGESDGESNGEMGEIIAIMQSDSYLNDPSYTNFSADRLRSEMELLIPTPYDSWNFEDPCYGPTKAQFEERGIDLEAWYAAH